MNLVERLKKDKKGFTLVEMIVVIVIIGILLAILVPGMFKYIQKAKDKQILVDARTAYLDVQMAAQEAYGVNGITGANVEAAFEDQIKNISGTKVVEVTAGTGSTTTVKVTVDVPENGKVTVTDIDSETGKVKSMTYVRGDREITMTDEVWGEVKPVGSDGSGDAGKNK